ncbi:MAG: hypothetical protein K9J74_03830 [Sulfuritalea sp.]|nr:hypothetical protein [Sulfuritalea sp.]
MKARKRRAGAAPAQRNPKFPEVLKPLLKLVQKKRYQDVERAAIDLRRVLPSHPFVLKSLSFALIGLKRHDEALTILGQAIGFDDQDPELHNNLGIALSSLMRSDMALDAFNRALELNPGDAEIWKNKGQAFCITNRWNEAIPCLFKAVELYSGDYDEAIDLLAKALLNAERNEEALACYMVLADADPDSAVNLACLIVLALRMSRWSDLANNLSRLRQMTAGFAHSALAPGHALVMPGIDGGELRDVASIYAQSTVAVQTNRPLFVRHPPVKARSDRRIRVGYLSSDFRDHPVGHVIAQLIELHDRSSFEIFAYSMSASDGSEIRQRLERSFDRFVDITALGIESGAEKIADDGIDILIDLQGWTSGNRAGMLALRPAPVQVNWLGYAGTMGDQRLADYVLGDPTVTPIEHEPLYSEKILQLPHCYLPMDATTRVPPAPQRSDVGLPETAFVFCSMNKCNKFNPQVFDVWCAILKATPDSVLWLSRPVAAAATNLLAEVSTRGVSPDRIVFAEGVASRPDHLARLQLADLALDPSPYNSHSSGIDTLWVGVPMVTLLGDAFAGRVGASLLNAVGLPECITHSWAQYQQRCIELYQRPEQLRQLKQRLLTSRSTAPLFDMPQFVRSLEDIYLKISESGSMAKSVA